MNDLENKENEIEKEKLVEEELEEMEIEEEFKKESRAGEEEVPVELPLPSPPEKAPESPFRIGENSNEYVHTTTGELQYTVTDLRLPGKNGFDLVIGRRYHSQSANMYATKTKVVKKERLHEWLIYYKDGIFANLYNKDGYYINGSICGQDYNKNITSLRKDEDGANFFGKTQSLRGDNYLTDWRPNTHFTEEHGLGYGWQFSFPSIEKVPFINGNRQEDNVKVLHLGDGRSYVIERSSNYWDTEERKTDSGLNTNSNEVIIRKPYNTTYIVTLQKEAVEIRFDENDKLKVMFDRFGNKILFSYQGNRLHTVTDTYGRVFTLTNVGNTLSWVSNFGETEVTYGVENNKLTSVTDKAGRKTRFAYQEEVGEEQCFPSSQGDKPVALPYCNLTGIVYPSGATSTYSYQKITEYKHGIDAILTLFRTKSYFAIQSRKDTVDGKEYNVSSYQYRMSERDGQVGKDIATVIHTKDKKTTTYTVRGGYCHHEVVKCEGIKTTETDFTYGDTSTFCDPSKIKKLVTRQYSPDGKYITTEKIYNYSPDFKGNVIREQTLVKDHFGAIVHSQEESWSYSPEHNIEIYHRYSSNEGEVIEKTRELRSDKRAISKEELHRSEALSAQQKSFQITRYQYEGDQVSLCHIEKKLQAQRFYSEMSYSYGNYSPNPTTIGVCKNPSTFNSFSPKEITEEKIEYDWYGRQKSHTNAKNETTLFTYDILGRQVKTTFPNGDTTQILYNDSSNEATVLNEAGEALLYRYTPLGDVLEIIAVKTATKLFSYEYDVYQRATKEISYGDAGEVRYALTNQYDGSGRKTASIVDGSDMLSYTEQYSYDDVYEGRYFRVIKTILGDATAPDSKTVVYLNAVGQTVKKGYVYQNQEYLSEFTYNKLGQEITTLTPKDKSLGYLFSSKKEYDIFGNVVTEWDTNNDSIVYQYDIHGNVVSVQDKKLQIVETRKYDALNRLEWVANAFRKIESYEYDAVGNLIQKTAANFTADQISAPIHYTYDNRGRVIKSECGTETHYEYDVLGNPLVVYTGVVNGNKAAGMKTSYTYNHFGKVLTITNPAGYVESYTYDRTGRLLSKQDYNGTTLSFTYDGIDRICSTKAQTAEGKITLSKTGYAANGKVRFRQNETLTTTYTYDARGFLVLESDSDGTNKFYEYGISGERTRFSLYRNDTIRLDLSYTYDILNRLYQVVCDGILLCTYSYDKNNNRISKMLSNGLSTHYTHNKASQLTLMEHRKGSTVLEIYTHAYYDNGMLFTIKKKVGSEAERTEKSYVYDEYGRLVTEKNGEKDFWVNRTYEYDLQGNRVKQSTNNSPKPHLHNNSTTVETTEYRYNNLNQLVEENTLHSDNAMIPEYRNAKEKRVYQYDKNGNQTYSECSIEQDTKLAYQYRVSFKARKEEVDCVEVREYNGFNELTYVHKDGTEIHYAYTPAGLRYSKEVDGNKVIHLWDGMNIVLDLNGNGNIRGRYLRGSELVSLTQDGNLFYYLHNTHGDVTHLADRTGGILRHYAYDAFGGELTPNPLDYNPFRYCGEYYDKDTKTIYLRARNYNPRTGRFTSEDPAKDGENWYSYCGGNPVAFVDPLGLAIKLTGTNEEKQTIYDNLLLLADGTTDGKHSLFYEADEFDDWNIYYDKNIQSRMNIGGELVRQVIDNQYMCIVQTTSSSSNMSVAIRDHASTVGTGGSINFNPEESVFAEVLTVFVDKNGNRGVRMEQIPREISLGHELIHVLRSMKGEFILYDIDTKEGYAFYNYRDGNRLFGRRGKIKVGHAGMEEIETTGLTYTHPDGTIVYDTGLDITENSLRAERGYRRRVKY